jgi:CheY-like chemotaxis protein
MTRILVADDDPPVRSAIRLTLEAEGYEVDEAPGGSEVLRLQQERPCDLPLIDLYMPGVDGLETIVRLKAEQPELKIVALSGGGYRNPQDVLAMAVDAGASGALSKPFERTDLLAAVSLALDAG